MKKKIYIAALFILISNVSYSAETSKIEDIKVLENKIVLISYLNQHVVFENIKLVEIGNTEYLCGIALNQTSWVSKSKVFIPTDKISMMVIYNNIEEYKKILDSTKLEQNK